MLHLVSGISYIYLFVNLILVPVPPFQTPLFLHLSLFPLLINHSAHPYLPLSFTPSLNLPVSQNTLVVSLLPAGALTDYCPDRFF